jgi:hypothetical protein
MLRTIFGPKREDVAGGWRRTHNEELHNLYASPIIRVIKSRKMGWVRHVAWMEEMRNAYVLVGKAEGKRPLGRPRHRWEGNIAMDLRKTGWKGADWMHLAQERDQWQALVNMVMNLQLP